MGSIDIKFYWAVFLRRLPYFLVITAFLTAVAGTIAAILPPVYRSEASMLVEPQQIPGDLAETTVPINPFEQAQIIEQRLMTRANLLDLANRVGIFADEAEPMPANALIADIRDRIEFIGFTPDVTQMRGVPGAIIIGVAFEGPTPELANKGANELVSLVLQENVRLRTGRAGDTLEFFESEVDKLSAALERQAARIAEFKTANVAALPDSMAARRAQQEREQQRLLALEREEAALRNQRATVVWVFERTGRSAGLGALSPEETELQALKSQLIQQRAEAVLNQALSERQEWALALGDAPAELEAAAAWRRQAQTVAAYRDRYGITTRTPLDPAPDSDAQKIDAARAKAALARLRDLASTEGHDDPSRTVRREGASRRL